LDATMTTNESDNQPYAEFGAFESAGWTDVAAVYPTSFGRVTMLAVEPLLFEAGVESGMRVLDVACGPGFAAEAAVRRGAQAVGIDFSATMVESARQRCPAAEFREADATALPFEDASFHRVVSNFGVQHFPDPDRALAEMARVLRPRGRLAFTVWDATERSEGQRLLHAAISACGRTDVTLPEAPPADRFADAAEVKRVLLEVGLVHPRTTPLPLVLRAPSARDLFEVYLRGTVRLGGLLRAQPPELLTAIRDEFKRLLIPYTVPGGVSVPMRAVLSSATRP
jgi:SAM-dependent methyltransferase